MVQPHDNPGWFTPADLLLCLIPGIGIARAMQGGGNYLQVIRLLFAAFTNVVVMLGVVAFFLAGDSDSTSMPVSTVLLIVVAAGVAGLVTPGLMATPLDCSSPASLLGSYRALFFMRLAFAEVAALVGFVGVVMSGTWWVYLVGAAFTFVGFVRLAPTESNLRRDQDVLNAAGCGLSLHGLMISPPA